MLRQSMQLGKMTIDGINAPPADTVMTTPVQMTHVAQPRPQLTVQHTAVSDFPSSFNLYLSQTFLAYWCNLMIKAVWKMLRNCQTFAEIFSFSVLLSRILLCKEKIILSTIELLPALSCCRDRCICFILFILKIQFALNYQFTSVFV